MIFPQSSNNTWNYHIISNSRNKIQQQKINISHVYLHFLIKLFDIKPSIRGRSLVSVVASTKKFYRLTLRELMHQTHFCSCSMSLALIICIREVKAAGIIMIGVRDVLLLLGVGRASDIGREVFCSTVFLPVDTPSVTDFRDAPWNVFVTSILNSPVSEKSQQINTETQK